MKHPSPVFPAGKWLCMLLAVLMLLPLCTSFVSAADGAGVISAAAIEAAPGETVSLPIVITDNPGIAIVRLSAAYDAALTFGGTTDTGLIPGGLHEVTAQNPVVLYWNNHLAEENVTSDGTLAELVFTVPANAEIGTVYPVTLTADASDILDADAEPVSAALAAGSITVVHRHTLTSVSAKAATCVAEGNIAYQVCTDCGDYLTPAGDIIADKNVTVAKDASNHVGPMERTGAVAATEEAEGYTGDVRCAGCDTVVTAGTTIARLDHTHDMVYTAAASATCTDTGNIAYYRCASCGKYYNDEAGTKELTAAQTVVAATGHNWSAWSEPAASEDGSTAVSTRTCSGCNAAETRTVEIEKQISAEEDSTSVKADVYTSEDNTDAEIAVTTIEVTDETAETVTIDATAAVGEDTTVSAVTLSADAVSTVTSEDNSVSEVAITTSAGTVQMDTAALSGIADEGDGSVTITMSVKETTEEVSAEDEVVAGMNESQQETLASVTADENTEVAAAVDISAGDA
ncbi:MAG: hypothetical protein IJ302_06985, partial [Clostridia bacterium]|nr:hypothetical protein [Clostridia bacterium]